MKKSKSQLIKEAQDMADKLEDKKKAIETALDELDRIVSKEGVNAIHMEGISAVEKMFEEFDEIELAQSKVLESIKSK